MDLELRSVPFHTVHCIVADLSSISDFWLGLPTGILFVNVLFTPGMTSGVFHELQLIDFPGGLDVPHLDMNFTPWKVVCDSLTFLWIRAFFCTRIY